VAISKTVASAAGFGGTPDGVKVLSFKPILKNSLRFAINVELASGLQTLGIMGFEGDGKRWISPPGVLVLIDGQHITSESTGKKAYAQIFGFRDAKTRERFGKAVTDLVLQQHPDAFSVG